MTVPSRWHSKSSHPRRASPGRTSDSPCNGPSCAICQTWPSVRRYHCTRSVCLRRSRPDSTSSSSRASSKVDYRRRSCRIRPHASQCLTVERRPCSENIGSGTSRWSLWRLETLPWSWYLGGTSGTSCSWSANSRCTTCSTACCSSHIPSHLCSFWSKFDREDSRWRPCRSRILRWNQYHIRHQTLQLHYLRHKLTGQPGFRWPVDWRSYCYSHSHCYYCSYWLGDWVCYASRWLRTIWPSWLVVYWLDYFYTLDEMMVVNLSK